MTDEMLTTGINDAYEGMLHAQGLMDMAQTEMLKGIAESLYRAHWTNYYVLLEVRKQRKRERMTKEE